MSLGKDDLKREMKPVKVIGPAALGTLYGILRGIEAAGEIVLPAPEPVAEAPGALAPKKKWGSAVKKTICYAEKNTASLKYSMFQMFPDASSAKPQIKECILMTRGITAARDLAHANVSAVIDQDLELALLRARSDLHEAKEKGDDVSEFTKTYEQALAAFEAHKRKRHDDSDSETDASESDDDDDDEPPRKKNCRRGGDGTLQIPTPQLKGAAFANTGGTRHIRDYFKAKAGQVPQVRRSITERIESKRNGFCAPATRGRRGRG